MKTTLLSLIFVLTAFATTAFSQTITIIPKLTPEQITAMEKIKTEAEKHSAPIALQLAETTKKIFANMLSAHENQKLRAQLSKDLHKFAGQLLDIKGQSYRDTLAVLTPIQKELVLAEMKKPVAPADLAEIIGRTFGTH